MTARVKTKSMLMRISILGLFFLPALLRAESLSVSSTEVTVASKRTKDSITTITSSDGRLKGGENRICTVFQKRVTNELEDVKNVNVEFTLLVGKMQGEPIRTHPVRDRMGHFCGQVDLGKQYYFPSSYNVFVRYSDTDGKEKKVRFYLSVK